MHQLPSPIDNYKSLLLSYKLGTGSQSSLKKPWPLAQNVAFLDKIEVE